MKKSTLIKVTSSIVASSAFVIILFLGSFDFSKQRNEFLRQFPPHAIFENDTFALKYNSYYIAGGYHEHIYLGNHMAPLHILDVNTSNGDTSYIKITLENIDSLKYRSFRLKIDSPYFYLADGTVPLIYTGATGTWKGKKEVYNNAYFSEYMPLNKNSLIIRSLSSTTNEYELGKETKQIPNIQINPDILQKQIDGVFCVDGKLNYDKQTNKIIYTYFYRNEFIVTDTTLSLIYRGKTIDNISRAQLNIDTINSSNTSVRSGLPLTVNKLSAVDHGYLFINSNLRAKNEIDIEFETGSVIDVYNTENGDYKLSFYIHNFNKDKMREFKVIKNTLVVLFNRHIITYDLRSQYFDSDKLKSLVN